LLMCAFFSLLSLFPWLCRTYWSVFIICATR
jgi:hypothetical protein